MSLKRHCEILKLLASSKSPAIIKAVLKTASRDLLRTLCECSHNILLGRVRLTSEQKRRLRRHKDKLRVLVRKKVSTTKRKEILQSGGFISALLGPLMSVLTGLLGR